MKVTFFTLLLALAANAGTASGFAAFTALPDQVATAAEARALRGLWLRAVSLGHEAEMAALGDEEARAAELGRQSLELWERVLNAYANRSDAKGLNKERDEVLARMIAQVHESKSRIYGQILRDTALERLELAEAVSWSPTNEKLKERLTRLLAKAEARTSDNSVPFAEALPESPRSPLTPLPPVIGVVEELPIINPETK